MIVTEQQRRERWARQGRKRGALWTPKSSPPRSPVLAPVVCTQIDPGRCAADPSCVFPPVVQSLCRQHARDAVAEQSTVGTAHALLREYGMVERADKQQPPPDRRRCRTK